jgi:hypothetical protein
MVADLSEAGPMKYFDKTTILLIAVLCVALLDWHTSMPAFAADLAIPPLHIERVHPGPQQSTHEKYTPLENFQPDDALGRCTAWTDGCRSCGRNPDGVSCSNIGFACQPSAPRCTRR